MLDGGRPCGEGEGLLGGNGGHQGVSGEGGEVDPLFQRVAIEDDDQAWAEVDAWVGSLHGFDTADIQVISDTLHFNLPFAANRRAAQSPADRAAIREFCATLEVELADWSSRFGRPLGRWLRWPDRQQAAASFIARHRQSGELPLSRCTASRSHCRGGQQRAAIWFETPGRRMLSRK